MAMKCYRCHGIIPDVTFDGSDRFDCRNHKKPESTIDFEEYRRFRSD